MGAARPCTYVHIDTHPAQAWNEDEPAAATTGASGRLHTQQQREQRGPHEGHGYGHRQPAEHEPPCLCLGQYCCKRRHSFNFFETVTAEHAHEWCIFREFLTQGSKCTGRERLFVL